MPILEERERLEQAWERWALEVPRPSCSACGNERMQWNGRPKRSVTVLGEDGRGLHVPQVVCRRARCGCCRTSVRLQPPGVICHKHYQPCVVAHAVGRYAAEPTTTMQEAADEVGCDRRTVARWRDWTPALGEPMVLVQKIVEATDAVVVPLVRTAAKRGGDVLRRAAQMLGLLEVLGSVWGLEPPGLRGVLCRLLRGRTGIATYARPLVPELARGQPS